MSALQDEERFMRRAIELSRRCLEEKCGPPFGSVIVKDGVIVGEGYNQVDRKGDPTSHGEIEAIRQACEALGTADLSGCLLYASSEPCPMCSGAISMARLDGLVFGAAANLQKRWAGYTYPLTPDQLSLATLQRKLPTRQMLAEEALAVVLSSGPRPD